MAKLTAAARKKLPKSAFLGPGRTFPGQDKNHLRAAITGATRSEHAGNISKSTEQRIKGKARARLQSKVTKHSEGHMYDNRRGQ